MATELGQAYVQIMPSARGISGMIKNQIEPEAASAGAGAGMSLGGRMVAAVSAAIAAAQIGKFFAASISEGSALQQSLGGVETLFKGSANRVKQYAAQAYKTSGVSANAYMENVTSFAASLVSSLGGNTKKAADLANTAMVDMSDNANKMGTDMDLIQQTYQSLARGNYAMLDNLKLGYGGTKSEMERLMADAEKLTGEHYTVGDFADTVKAIHAVQESLGITGTTAKEASTTLSGSMNAMKAAFQDVLGNLALGKDIEPSLNALAETTSTFFFGNFLPMVGNILSGLPSAITTFLAAAGPQIASGFQSLFSGLGVDIDFSGLTAKFQGIVTAVQPVITGLQTAFGQIPGFFSSIVSAITPVIDAIVSGIARMDFSGIQTLISSIIPAIQSGFSIMMSIVGPAIDGVVNSFVSLWNAAQPLISVLSAALMPVFQALGSFLGGFFAGALAAVKFAFDALSVVIQFLTPIIQLIVMAFSALSPVINFVAQVVGTVIGAFSGLSAVGGVMQRVVTTAWNAIQAAISIAGNFIISIIGGVKTVFGALGVAAGIMKGIVSGAWNGLKAVITVVANVIKGAINGAKATFNAFGSGVGAVAGSVKGFIGGIKSTFNSLRNINLASAGSAIIKGFLGGLQSAWNAGKHFISGIAKWIKDHKGPISYDRRLLIPAGKAIMQGLNAGLITGFADVKSNVLNMGQDISDQLDVTSSVDLSSKALMSKLDITSTVADDNKKMLEYQQILIDAVDRLGQRPIQTTAVVDGSSFNRENALYQSAESARRQSAVERGLATDVRF
ncbi:phage tail protein [Ligilactobacillus saerimneri]|uniref:phage tail protein n=1 Tax=Ligilactobacillus saerimneri TaxID=228229 RepID=UPI00041767D7|nr:hypothetical protein [Ligilactobacillus saerimneri]KRL73532.1 phage protein [Ligilactobacillus saerimneri DSM 16049]